MPGAARSIIAAFRSKSAWSTLQCFDAVLGSETPSMAQIGAISSPGIDTK